MLGGVTRSFLKQSQDAQQLLQVTSLTKISQVWASECAWWAGQSIHQEGSVRPEVQADTLHPAQPHARQYDGGLEGEGLWEH